MRFGRGNFFSALAGLIVGVMVIAMLPAGAANGDQAIMGEKNKASQPTKFVSRNATQFTNTKAGRPAIRLFVEPGTPPMGVNSQVKVDNLNADLLDGMDAAAFSLDGHPHAWSDLTSGVPAGLADGDDDTLGGLDCEPGQLAKRNPADTAWVCGDDGDTILTDADTLDGLDSTDFLGADDQAVDSVALGGAAASAYELAPGVADPNGLPYLGDSCLFEGGHLLGHTASGFPICSLLGSLSSLTDSGTTYGSANTFRTALGDLDGDGDLDAFEPNGYDVGNRVLLNGGNGLFTDTGQSLGAAHSVSASLGDLDGDGDLDAFVATGPGPQQVWLNDGSATFTAGQAIGDETGASNEIRLGDLDGDGDLDAFMAWGASGNQVWLNDGSGTFTDTTQALGSLPTAGLGLADFDGDGDLDAYVGNYSGVADEIWLNDGLGTFTDSGQTLGSSTTYDVAIGDLDGDGDLDACAVAEYNGCEKWINDGTGTFASTGTVGVANRTVDVEMGDIDGDGDLDILLAKSHNPDEIWLNDGTGTFTASAIVFPTYTTYGMSVGDLDLDGDLDIYMSIFGANRVFFGS